MDALDRQDGGAPVSRRNRGVVGALKSGHWTVASHVIFFIFVCLRVIGNRHSPGGDFAQYLLHASNLVEGFPYETSVVGPAVYPGYPIFLSPVVLLFGINFFAIGLAHAIVWVWAVEHSLKRLQLQSRLVDNIARIGLLFCPPILVWFDEVIPTVTYSALVMAFSASSTRFLVSSQTGEKFRKSGVFKSLRNEVVILGLCAAFFRVEFLFCSFGLLIVGFILRNRAFQKLSLLLILFSIIARFVSGRLSSGLSSYGSAAEIYVAVKELYEMGGWGAVARVLAENTYGLLEMSVKSCFFFDTKFSGAEVNFSLEKLFIYGVLIIFMAICLELTSRGDSLNQKGCRSKRDLALSKAVVFVSAAMIVGQFLAMLLHSLVDRPPNRYFLHVLALTFFILLVSIEQLFNRHIIASAFGRKVLISVFVVPVIVVVSLWAPRWGDYYVRSDFTLSAKSALELRCDDESAVIYYKPRVFALKSRELGFERVVTWSSRELSRVTEALNDGSILVIALETPSNYRQEDLYNGLIEEGYVPVDGAGTSFPVFKSEDPCS